MIDATVTYVVYVLFENQQRATEILDWLGNTHHPKDQFLKRAIKAEYSKASHFSLLAIKFSTFVLLYGFFMIIFCATLAEYFIAGNSYPLPLPFYIPYLKPNDVITYTLNLIQHYWAGQTVICYYLALMSGGLVILIHLVLYFNVVIHLIKDIETIRQEASFEHWTKLVTETFLEIKNNLSEVTTLTEGLFYMFEKLCYGTVLVSWLIIKINKDEFIRAFGSFIVIFGVFFMVFINEMCLQKVTLILIIIRVLRLYF